MSHLYTIGDSESTIGKTADPYMRLKLTRYGPVEKNKHFLKKYEVLHETGHLLGLYHEHQHSELGENIFNEDIVVQDLQACYPDKKAATESYNRNFKAPKKLLDDPLKYPFDKNSVMKYRYVCIYIMIHLCVRMSTVFVMRHLYLASLFTVPITYPYAGFINRVYRGWNVNAIGSTLSSTTAAPSFKQAVDFS